MHILGYDISTRFYKTFKVIYSDHIYFRGNNGYLSKSEVNLNISNPDLASKSMIFRYSITQPIIFTVFL